MGRAPDVGRASGLDPEGGLLAGRGDGVCCARTNLSWNLTSDAGVVPVTAKPIDTRTHSTRTSSMFDTPFARAKVRFTQPDGKPKSGVSAGRRSKSRAMQLQIDTSERAAKTWLLMLLRGLLAIALGLVLLIWPEKSLQVIRVVFVAYALVDGIFSAVGAFRNASVKEPWIRRALEATIAIVAAIVVWLWPHIVLKVLGYVIGGALVLRGIVQIVGVTSLQGTQRVRQWLVAAGILSLIAGVVFLFSPRTGLHLFIWTLAVYGLVYGVILSALAFQLKNVANGAAASRL